MIDTPGHVDFTYEVSRSPGRLRGRGPAGRRRAGHRGADAGQPLPGAGERPHDHPGAQQDRPAGRPAGEVRRRAGAHHRLRPRRRAAGQRQDRRGRRASCSTEVVAQVPAPVGDADAPARAMIFDSVYDTYRGVVTYVRVVDGQLTTRERILMMSTGATHELLEIGVISPGADADQRPRRRRGRLPDHRRQGRPPVPGRRHRHQRCTSRRNRSRSAATRTPSRWCSPASTRSTARDYPELREALDKLQLNDAALVYEPETSAALGFGFRVRLPRPAAPGDRPRAAGARVRPRPDLDRAQRGLPGDHGGRHRARSSPTRASSRRRQDLRGLRADRALDRSWRRASTSARSWSCARAAAARCAAWTTCPRTGSSCATPCRWPRSSSTSSTR